MKTHPLVSVIIPIYEARAFIAETLQSVVEQTYPNIEILAIEDGSKRDSADIVQHFPQVTYIKQQNTGNPTARNICINKAKGAYISFLDCDDIFPHEKIAYQVAYLASHPRCPMVSGLTREFLSPGETMPRWVRDTAKTDHTGSSPGTWVIRREVFDKVGLFDPAFDLSADTDWLMRAKLMGIEFTTLRKVVLLKRIHSKNQSAHSTQRLKNAYHSQLLHIFSRSKHA